jgi:acyl-CoA oxidase
LLPLLARVSLQKIAQAKILEHWGKKQRHLFEPKNRKLAELHGLISGLKAVLSFESVAGISECRRACGGLGYSHYSGIGRFMQNLDVQQTWEGDNNILQM